MGNVVFAVVPVHVSHKLFSPLLRIVTGNNTNNKSESDQEDNDDVNDNDWSYGAEKKGDLIGYFFVRTLGFCYISLWNDYPLTLDVLLSQPKKGNLTRYSFMITTIIFNSN